MGKNKRKRNEKRVEAAENGGVRFGLDVSKVYNDQTKATEAVANFAAEASKCSADNPLWYIVAGPMEMPWRCLNASPADKRQYIHCISHSTWNEDHNDALNAHTWADMKRDFPTVTYHDIIDQNNSNGENDFNSAYGMWEWLKTSGNADWIWLYNRNEKSTFDVSDAGMTYWLITGGPNGGNDKGGWAETKALFENPIINDPEDKDGDGVKDAVDNCPDTYNKDQADLDNDGKGDLCDDDIDGDGINNDVDNCPTTANADQADRDNDGIGDVCDDYPDDAKNGAGNGITLKDDYVICEAEATSSTLGLWQLIKNGQANYVNDASGNAHLEFTGNNPSSGPATSPLKYTFTIKNEGYYRMIFRARKRLAGEESDKCNDCYVKMEGDFDAPATTNVHKTPATEDQLRQNYKFYGGNANDWGWAQELDMGGTNNKRYAIYKFKAGQTYTVTISGRAQRFNVDYLMWYNEAKYTMDQAKQIRPDASGNVDPQTSACITYKAVQFPTYTGISGYVNAYVDTPRDALAINATVVADRDKYAAAQRTFDGETGKYKITLVTLLETDGESTYKVKIGDNYYGGVMKNNETATDYIEQKHEIADSVLITKGDVIQVEFMAVTNGQIPENGGTAYSRGRWRSIEFNKAGCNNTGGSTGGTQPDEAQAFPGKTWTIPGEIEAIYFDAGGEGKAYHDADAGASKGLLLAANPRYAIVGQEDVEIETNNVGWINDGEWLRYTISHVTKGDYKLKAMLAANPANGGDVTISLNGEVIANIVNATTTGWQEYQAFTSDVSIANDLTDAVLKVEFSNSSATSYLLNINSILFEAASGTKEIGLDHFKMYPNPVKDILYLNGSENIEDIAICALDGRKIKQLKPSQENTVVLNSLNSGIYLVQLKMRNGEIYSRKLIKE